MVSSAARKILHNVFFCIFQADILLSQFFNRQGSSCPQNDLEGGQSVFAVHQDPAIQAIDNAFGNSQAQPIAAGTAVAGRIRPVKPLKDLLA